MWNYEKRLQYPVKITQTNPKIAQVIITQFGGPCCSNLSYFFVYLYLHHSHLSYTILHRSNDICNRSIPFMSSPAPPSLSSYSHFK
ncbi:manganese catalase family protein [Lachnospiraceae bacterium 42-17]